MLSFSLALQYLRTPLARLLRRSISQSPDTMLRGSSLAYQMATWPNQFHKRFNSHSSASPILIPQVGFYECYSPMSWLTAPKSLIWRWPTSKLKRSASCSRLGRSSRLLRNSKDPWMSCLARTISSFVAVTVRSHLISQPLWPGFSIPLQASHNTTLFRGPATQYLLTTPLQAPSTK